MEYYNQIETTVIKEVCLEVVSSNTYQQVQVSRNENEELILSELIQEIRLYYEAIESGVQVFYMSENEMNQEEWHFVGIDPISTTEVVPFKFSHPSISLKFRQRKVPDKGGSQILIEQAIQDEE